METCALQGLATTTLSERSLSNSRHASELTEEQLPAIETRMRKWSNTGGHKPSEDLLCFERIPWMLHGGARWKDLRDMQPSPATRLPRL